MPKKSGLMNVAEAAICARVKSCRETIMWPQVAFAAELGITHPKLVSIEYGHTPLRFGVGLNLCRFFEINGVWLATGRGEMSGNSKRLRSAKYDSPTYTQRLFSEVYRQSPESFLSDRVKTNPPQLEPTPGFKPKSFLLERVRSWFHANTFSTPLLKEYFARSVAEFGDNVLLEHRRAAIAKRVRINSKSIKR